MSHSFAAVVAFGVAILGTAARAEDKPDAPYIKVEIKGTLETGIVSIGGETTGTLIKAGNVTWELDLSKADKKSDAEKLNGKLVIVTGNYQKKKGVEIKERHIVEVATLKGADQK